MMAACGLPQCSWTTVSKLLCAKGRYVVDGRGNEGAKNVAKIQSITFGRLPMLCNSSVTVSKQNGDSRQLTATGPLPRSTEQLVRS